MKLISYLLIIIIIPIIIATIFFSTAFFILFHQQIVEEKLIAMKNLALQEAKELENAVYFGNKARINEVFEAVQHSDDVISVHIVKTDGTVLSPEAHSKQEAHSELDGGSEEKHNEDTHDEIVTGVIFDKDFINAALMGNQVLVKELENSIMISVPIGNNETLGAFILEYSTARTENLINEIIFSIVFINTGAAAIAILAAIRLSKGISKPIKNLQNLAIKISEGRKIEPVKNYDLQELSSLRDTLIEMQEKIEGYQKKVIEVERLSSIGQLASRLAHDIRSPLTVISGIIDMIKDESLFHDNKERNIHLLESAIQRITHQIDNVLDFVKPQSLKLQQVSLKDIVDSVLDELYIAKNIKIVSNFEDFKCKCDPDSMRIVFINIINNAIQAIGKSEGKITINVLSDKEKITIQISNTGKSIPKDIISRIFDPLFTTKQEGTGLGLSSCKNIVEQHGGTISVKNDPVTFIIKIPYTLDANSN